jgi:hypothetical protein
MDKTIKKKKSMGNNNNLLKGLLNLWKDEKEITKNNKLAILPKAYSNGIVINTVASK